MTIIYIARTKEGLKLYRHDFVGYSSKDELEVLVENFRLAFEKSIGYPVEARQATKEDFEYIRKTFEKYNQIEQMKPFDPII